MTAEQNDSLMLADAAAARRAFARAATKELAACGSVLWAFGLVEERPRRALAVVMQTAASLSEGTIQLLETGNRYAASALIRQLIEIEYLLWLFRIDSTAAADWLTITDEKGRSRFRPGSMRRRSGKRFQAGEYHTHCEMGGHPHPRGGGLLPERYFANAESEARLVELLWLDFAIHLDRAWREYELTRHAFRLKQIVVASDAVEAMRVAYREWYAADPLGRDAVEGRKLHSATTSAPAG